MSNTPEGFNARKQNPENKEARDATPENAGKTNPVERAYSALAKANTVTEQQRALVGRSQKTEKRLIQDANLLPEEDLDKRVQADAEKYADRSETFANDPKVDLGAPVEAKKGPDSVPDYGWPSGQGSKNEAVSSGKESTAGMSKKLYVLLNNVFKLENGATKSYKPLKKNEVAPAPKTYFSLTPKGVQLTDAGHNYFVNKDNYANKNNPEKKRSLEQAIYDSMKFDNETGDIIINPDEVYSVVGTFRDVDNQRIHDGSTNYKKKSRNS